MGLIYHEKALPMEGFKALARSFQGWNRGVKDTAVTLFSWPGEGSLAWSCRGGFGPGGYELREITIRGLSQITRIPGWTRIPRGK